MTMRLVYGCLVVMMAAGMMTEGRAADDAGQGLYAGHCSRCHGSEGRGAQAPRLVPFDWTDEEAMEQIRRPLCDMPPIPPSELSDAEAVQIIEYLRSIR